MDSQRLGRWHRELRSVMPSSLRLTDLITLLQPQELRFAEEEPRGQIVVEYHSVKAAIGPE